MADGPVNELGITGDEDFVAKPIASDHIYSTNSLRDDLNSFVPPESIPTLEPKTPEELGALFTVPPTDSEPIQPESRIEPPLKGIKKYMPITMPSNEVSNLDPLGHYENSRTEGTLIDLKKINPELAIKLKQEKEKWFNGVQSAIADGANIDFQKAFERLNIETEARLEISKFLTDQHPNVSMMEKWLGEPLQGAGSNEPVSPLKPRGAMTESPLDEPQIPPADNIRDIPLSNAGPDNTK